MPVHVRLSLPALAPRPPGPCAGTARGPARRLRRVLRAHRHPAPFASRHAARALAAVRRAPAAPARIGRAGTGTGAEITGRPREAWRSMNTSAVRSRTRAAAHERTDKA